MWKESLFAVPPLGDVGGKKRLGEGGRGRFVKDKQRSFSNCVLNLALNWKRVSIMLQISSNGPEKPLLVLLKWLKTGLSFYKRLLQSSISKWRTTRDLLLLSVALSRGFPVNKSLIICNRKHQYWVNVAFCKTFSASLWKVDLVTALLAVSPYIHLPISNYNWENFRRGMQFLRLCRQRPSLVTSWGGKYTCWWFSA